ncbi:tetrahydromethanopterin S-methyltransferase subunit MtrB [Methanobacterium sp. ACI-7]|uniref:tetrahydromethanopterin S-methyltransferase subunit MtrB n=1 Tax=unclassified Methanobacterium TaxID=2627676 RepID=UPI0039C1F357
MVEMLPNVNVVPEMNLTLDPSTGIIGAGMKGAVLVSMDDINAEISTLELAADDLMNSLDPTTTSYNSYPGREGVYLTAGKFTNVVYGFLLGLVLLIAAFAI